MATLFLEPGSDATGDMSLFLATDVLNGTVATDTTQFKNGLRSIKTNMTGAGHAFAYSADGVTRDAGTRVSAWVMFSDATPATVTCFLGTQATANGATIIGVGLTTTGTLRICGRSATAVDGTTVLLDNTWYRITFSWLITSASVWSAKVWLNGVLEASTSNTQGNLGATAGVALSIGQVASGSVDTFGTPAQISIYYDNIYVDNGTGVDDPGDIRCTAKRPNANGTTNDFVTQVGSGGSGYGSGHSPQVNEQPLSATNGWSVVAVAATTEEYNIESASTGDVNISTATLIDYMGWVYTKALVAETGQIIVNNATSNISITTSNAMFTKIAGSTAYPAGTGTDIGEITSTTATTVSLYECGIIFAYKPNTALGLLSLLGAG